LIKDKLFSAQRPALRNPVTVWRAIDRAKASGINERNNLNFKVGAIDADALRQGNQLSCAMAIPTNTIISWLIKPAFCIGIEAERPAQSG